MGRRQGCHTVLPPPRCPRPLPLHPCTPCRNQSLREFPRLPADNEATVVAKGTPHTAYIPPPPPVLPLPGTTMELDYLKYLARVSKM